jgi:hypothetical protein
MAVFLLPSNSLPVHFLSVIERNKYFGGIDGVRMKSVRFFHAEGLFINITTSFPHIV